MTLVESRPVSLPPQNLVKMEERKRPASLDEGDSAAPPLKKQATIKEDKGRKRDEADLPGGADMERFRKEAIYRQMLEFKREKQTLESRLAEAVKIAANRDEFIRKTDAFAEQLVDVCRIRRTQNTTDRRYKPVPSELLSSSDVDAFEKYLDSRATALKAELDTIFDSGENVAQDKEELLSQLAKCKEAEKAAFSDMERARQERDLMIQRLETATSRYMIAEKKLDRAKSSTVQKLEQQAMASSRSEAQSSKEDQSPSRQTNGTTPDAEAITRADEARIKAEASAAKQKEQLDQVVSENEKLSSRLTTLQAKQSSLTDEDFASTDLFLHLRTQHDEVLKRVNDLEATNIELRKEAEKLQAERSAYKVKMELEQQALGNERDLNLAKLEADLARIRSARDDLYTRVQASETNDEQERASIEQFRKLIESKDERIKALESELERVAEEKPSTSSNLEDLPAEELRQKYSSMEQSYNMLNEELQGLGIAYKRLQSTALAKINNQTDLEERVKKATADKNKADQRFFAAMKAKDTLSAEVRALRAQASKSSDLISGLRDAEQSSKTLVQSCESQLAKANELVDQLTKQTNKAQSDAAGLNTAVTGLKAQLDELKEQLVAKDATVAEVKSAKRKVEAEMAELNASLSERDKQIEATKKNKGSVVDSGTIEMLRTLAMCTVCRKNFKDTAIKTCGHTMCIECVEERITSRSRKCPHCNKAFGRDDYMRITLN